MSESTPSASAPAPPVARSPLWPDYTKLNIDQFRFWIYFWRERGRRFPY